MRNLLFPSAMAALAIAGASISVARAAEVLSPDGDPFPSDSVAYLTGGPYDSPWGTFDMTTVANFDGFTFEQVGSNEIYLYSTTALTTGPTQTATFDNGGVLTTATLTNGDVEVEILGRTSAFETGTFSAEILMATWTGTIDGDSVTAQLNPAVTSPGTITFSLPPPGELGLLVDYTFMNATEFSVNGSPFVSTPLTGVSAPVPEASTWTLMIVGFASLGFAAHRQARGRSRPPAAA